MRAISLWQPWATLMCGPKTVETRGRQTGVRGEVAVCAARSVDGLDALTEPELAAAAAKVLGFTSCMTDGGFAWAFRLAGVLPFGKVVCVVDLFGCEETNAPMRLRHAAELAFGDYSDGRYGWLTRNMRRLADPVPVVGHQGFFWLPKDVEKEVRKQI